MSLSAWWRNLRTAYNLAARLEDLEAEWDQVRQDWIDKRDALDRLLRRLTLREVRSRETREDAPGPAIVPQTPTDSGSPEKDALRARARAQGLLR